MFTGWITVMIDRINRMRVAIALPETITFSHKRQLCGSNVDEHL
jgi:hypothetical protein